MSWTKNVTCSRCWGSEWHVYLQVWTCCSCGKQMTPGEIRPYHLELARQEAKRKAAEQLSSETTA